MKHSETDILSAATTIGCNEAHAGHLTKYSGLAELILNHLCPVLFRGQALCVFSRVTTWC